MYSGTPLSRTPLGNEVLSEVSLIQGLLCMYSGTSEIGTKYNRPLFKGHRSKSQFFSYINTSNTFSASEISEDNLSTKDKTAEFILSSTCSLFGGSTECHSTMHVYVNGTTDSVLYNRCPLREVPLYYNKHRL